MQFDMRDIEAALQKKGFDPSVKHHKYFTYRSKAGLLTDVYTYVSHSGKTLDGFLIAQMAKQVKLKKPQFLDLVRCPLSRDDYEQLLIENGEIDQPEVAD